MKSIESSTDIAKSTQVEIQAPFHIWCIYKFFNTYNASKAELLSLIISTGVQWKNLRGRSTNAYCHNYKENSKPKGDTERDVSCKLAYIQIKWVLFCSLKSVTFDITSPWSKPVFAASVNL